MQLIIKKLLIILLICLPVNLNLFANEIKVNDFGIIAIMYHRFEENKYPSTNIRMKEFLQHIDLIRKNKIEFVNPSRFESELINNKSKRKVLLTIDDGYKSFYEKAWPILRESKIPFILFVSTREVGKNGYMSWDEIKEIEKFDFVEIGNHSHTHEYLIDFNNNDIKKRFGRVYKNF